LIVFRAAVLTVALLFAAGPSASLLCKAWCDPDVAARDGCHHSGADSSASLTSDDSCESVRGMAVLLKEDVRPGSSLDPGFAVEMAKLRFGLFSITDRSAWHRVPGPSDRQRPLITPLRI
jgi:hypothetical protein